MILNFIYSWRNIWRNSRRTIITIVALTLNTAILITTFSLVTGMMDSSTQYITDLNFGEVQIHAPGYIEDASFYETIDNPGEIVQAANSIGVSAAPRTYGFGLLAADDKSAGVEFYGVIPELEKETLSLYEHMIDGEYLSHERQVIREEDEFGIMMEYGNVVIGSRLARTLDAKIGTELVAIVQAADGSMGTGLYKVAGILKSAGDKIDRSAVFMHTEDFKDLFVMGDLAHEIVLNSHGSIEALELKHVMKEKLPELEVRTWMDLNPTMADMVELTQAWFVIVGSIFFIVAGLGIMNTMLMAAFDRIREFGVLKALGTTPLRIFSYVIIEAFVIGSLSTICGLIIGVASAYYFQIYGIDVSVFGGDMSWGGIAFDPIWRAQITPQAVYQPVIILWIISVVASMYPAVIAARLNPVRAMTHY